jgi:hypothetical protein
LDLNRKTRAFVIWITVNAAAAEVKFVAKPSEGFIGGGIRSQISILSWQRNLRKDPVIRASAKLRHRQHRPLLASLKLFFYVGLNLKRREE